MGDFGQKATHQNQTKKPKTNERTSLGKNMFILKYISENLEHLKLLKLFWWLVVAQFLELGHLMLQLFSFNLSPVCFSHLLQNETKWINMDIMYIYKKFSYKAPSRQWLVCTFKKTIFAITYIWSHVIYYKFYQENQKIYCYMVIYVY